MTNITDDQRREVAARLRRAVVSDKQTDIYVELLEQDAAATRWKLSDRERAMQAILDKQVEGVE